MEKPRRVKPVRAALGPPAPTASLTAHDKQDGYILACQATVRGAVRVDA
jgi:ferredoxin